MRALPLLAALLLGGASLAACTHEDAPAAAPGIEAPEVQAPTQRFQITEIQVGRPGPERRVVVALHGRGDSPKRFLRVLGGWKGDARVLAPRAPLGFGDGWSWFAGSVRDGDSAALAQGIKAQADALALWLSSLRAANPEAPAPAVFGFSQGGMLTQALVALHPESLSLGVSMGGWLPPELWPQDAPANPPPLYVLHGQADPLVKLQPTLRAAEQLEAGGFDVRVQTWEGLGHSLNEEMLGQLYSALDDSP